MARCTAVSWCRALLFAFLVREEERYIATIREADKKFGVSGTDEKGEWIRARHVFRPLKCPPLLPRGWGIFRGSVTPAGVVLVASKPAGRRMIRWSHRPREPRAHAYIRAL